MFGKSPVLKSLELQKRLLLAESELNRAHLIGEIAVMKTSLRTFTDQACSFGSVATSAAGLMAGLATFLRPRPVDSGAKSNWLQTVLKGAGMLSTFWAVFRPQRSNPEKS